MDALWRLLWALPLVLAIGVGAMIVLRRFVAPSVRERHTVQRVVARETLSLSEQTRVHLIEVDGESFVVVESAQNASLQALQPQALQGSRSRARLQPAWLRRLSGVAQ